jgi:hypothetical protein
MKVELLIEEEEGENPDSEQDKNHRLLKRIYKEFPEALWERARKGFRIFI